MLGRVEVAARETRAASYQSLLTFQEHRVHIAGTRWRPRVLHATSCFGRLALRFGREFHSQHSRAHSTLLEAKY